MFQAKEFILYEELSLEKKNPRRRMIQQRMFLVEYAPAKKFPSTKKDHKAKNSLAKNGSGKNSPV
jgi:hypothetical protein